MIWFGRYEGMLKSLCHGMKNYDSDCCRSAAYIFCSLLPDEATICPMPSHYGCPTYMAKVCQYVSEIRKDIVVWDGLRCIPHDSSYGLKKVGLSPDIPEFFTIGDRPFGSIFVLDNVIATGKTASAVEKDGDGFIVVAIAKDMRRV